MASFAVFSPHLDDAVLGCADHIGAWLGQGHHVTVVNVFTAFENGGTVSPYMRPFMAAVGCAGPSDYARCREAEDREALARLGVESVRLGLIDAGFRGGPGRPDYQGLRDLCRERLGPLEHAVLTEAMRAFSELAAFDHVVVPLGVGGHVDHLIVRAAADALWPRRAGRIDYVEFPYGLAPWKWNIDTLGRLFRSRPSMRWISPQKRSLLDCYASQTPLLFKRRPYYPEILLYRSCAGGDAERINKPIPKI